MGPLNKELNWHGLIPMCIRKGSVRGVILCALARELPAVCAVAIQTMSYLVKYRGFKLFHVLTLRVVTLVLVVCQICVNLAPSTSTSREDLTPNTKQQQLCIIILLFM